MFPVEPGLLALVRIASLGGQAEANAWLHWNTRTLKVSSVTDQGRCSVGHLAAVIYEEEGGRESSVYSFPQRTHLLT